MQAVQYKMVLGPSARPHMPELCDARAHGPSKSGSCKPIEEEPVHGDAGEQRYEIAQDGEARIAKYEFALERQRPSGEGGRDAADVQSRKGQRVAHHDGRGLDVPLAVDVEAVVHGETSNCAQTEHNGPVRPEELVPDEFQHRHRD